MASGGGDLQSPKKRKREHAEGKTKKPYAGVGAKGKTKQPYGGTAEVVTKKQPVTPREKRLAAKELSEARKMRRKQNYSLEKELTKLWEKMRCHSVSNEDRSRIVSQALQKMNGKYLDIAGSHVTARVLQSCVKWCSQSERDAIFDALQPHFLILSRKKYAVFLVKKLIKLVVDYAFQLATPPQRRQLLLELYSTELQLFKGLTEQKSHSLLDTISKLGLQKSSVLQHMTIVIQAILEKGIIEYSIVHTAILEYFTIADKTSASDVIRQLIPLLTEGSSVMDVDEPSVATELPKKSKAKKKRLSEPVIVRIMHTRDSLKIAISCLRHGSAKGEAPGNATEVTLENKVDAAANKEDDISESTQIASDSKKDPSQRRHELLIKSELAEALVQSCTENVGELLRTNFGKDVLYEVAVGGKDNVLEGISDRIHMLHDAIASDAAQPKMEDIEHAFENFHSSRVIRKLIIDCPAFAVILWKKALKGKCKIWAHGHSSKVVAAFMESPSSKVKDLAKSELQPLIDSGVLKTPDHKPVEK
ncbi:hypothetical protein PR202_gb10367 [Eleusine coracana subsp. coracana]|uniref:CPL domain-containing protein n=1 Tax=Eleusine coracana subsp. coracana TaxID=191504 RepID=A0AAV5EKR6_ELECO|nr:hypothetical protein PR202_gb10367 [Eleusine coracana subsp. coracana]